MKRLFVVLLTVLMGLLLIAPGASAYSVSAGDLIKIDYGTGNLNGGGAFNIYKGNVLMFDTFCVERNEYFSPGNSYYIGSITNGAVQGGISGQTSPNFDQISSKTAYLYYRWATNVIAHTAANANALQLALWSFEGEISGLESVLAANTTALGFISDANTNSNGSLYGVQVLNIYGSYDPKTGIYTGYQQDQLVYNVPEPATLLLLGIGLLGIGFLRRKQ